MKCPSYASAFPGGYGAHQPVHDQDEERGGEDASLFYSSFDVKGVRSQMTPKCGENKQVAHEAIASASALDGESVWNNAVSMEIAVV